MAGNERLPPLPHRGTALQIAAVLKRSIDRDLIVSAQREALQTLRCIISNLEYRFYKAYGMEIEDKRTVYGECTYRLVPREDEPSVCLMHDWIYLPSA